MAAGGLVGGAPTPWPRALVCHLLGTGAPPCAGSADPAPWMLKPVPVRQSFPSHRRTSSQARAGTGWSLETPARSGRSITS